MDKVHSDLFVDNGYCNLAQKKYEFISKRLD